MAIIRRRHIRSRSQANYRVPQLDYFVSYFITDVIQSYVAKNEIFRRVADRNKAYKILARKALEKKSLVTLRGRMMDL